MGAGGTNSKDPNFSTHTRDRGTKLIQALLQTGTEEHVHTRGSYKDRRHTERVYKIRGAANISHIAPVHWMEGFGFHVILELLNTHKESERVLRHE